MYIRRIRLKRPCEEVIILVTDLTEEEKYTTIDLLAVYLERWGIERVFPQVTEVFNLDRLIGSTPHATIFQASFYLTLYNALQVFRQHISLAQHEPCDPEKLSTEQIFVDVKRQRIAVSERVPSNEITALIPKERTLTELKSHLESILQMEIPELWYKTKNKNHEHIPKKVKGTGAHTSVERLVKAANITTQTRFNRVHYSGAKLLLSRRVDASTHVVRLSRVPSSQLQRSRSSVNPCRSTGGSRESFKQLSVKAVLFD